MPAYYHRILNTRVIVFNHKEHGERLIFTNGETNPRNELGKNGVTFHRAPASWFYNTITIRVSEVKNGIHHPETEFKLNRSSLIKYLGEDASADDSDEDLIKILEAKLWSIGNLSEPIKSLNNSNELVRTRQAEAGEHLRHAGQHNKRVINHWSDPIADFFKGSFLSWLYQVTIRSINFIKLRFFVYGSEKDLFETGEILAKKRFQEASEDVPAFQKHIRGLDKDAETIFADIPTTSKANYIKKQKYDSDTHHHGKYPAVSKTDTSTGTTGEPTPWVRGEAELDTVKRSLELAAKLQMGDRRLANINAFALGPWATGLTSYELMRETGSVFATGPDEKKIYNEIKRITRDERHQTKLAVARLFKDNPNLNVINQKVCSNLIENTLKAILKDRSLKLEDAFNVQFNKLPTDEKKYLKDYKSKILAIVEELNKEKKQIIIAGYPPFLKVFVEYVKKQKDKKGNPDSLANYNVIGVVGGQAISEAMRDILIRDGFNEIYSSYGASDLDINLGVETEYEMLVRKTIEKNPGLARELYGSNKGLPMVFHYDTWNYHVECLDDNEEQPEQKDSLVFTANRDDRSSPRIRYDLGDKGRVYASSDIQALLAKYGVFQKPKVDLPLMFVWGRDSTVVFNGANLDFTELERALAKVDDKENVLKKAFYTYYDEQGNEKLEIWLELKDNINLPKDDVMAAFAESLIAELVKINQDFKYQVEQLGNGTPLPLVRFFERKQSPISEPDGHRKQVLVFKDEKYDFDGVACKGISIEKTDEIVNQHERLNII